jgi:two-component system, cell cycle sensor histidine kinase and response regulator CckA
MLPHVRILVADDDKELLATVATALERAGAEVVRASSGSELVDRMTEQGPFALVVTDIAMPWMSGLETIRSTRSVGVGTPVVVMTAIREEKLADEVRALGSNAKLLRKPFALADLEEAASSLLSASKGPKPD